MRDAERNAAEATRLLNEPLLVEALDAIMAEAFAEFKDIKITADNLPAVIALQARINSVHEIHDKLDAKIKASGQMDGGVQVEAKQPA